MIRLHRAERVLELTLDRPDKRNALNEAMYEQAVTALEGIEGDDGISAILLRAEGHYFCAGTDVTKLAGGPVSLPIPDRPVFKFMHSVLRCDKLELTHFGGRVPV